MMAKSGAVGVEEMFPRLGIERVLGDMGADAAG